MKRFLKSKLLSLGLSILMLSFAPACSKKKSSSPSPVTTSTSPHEAQTLPSTPTSLLATSNGNGVQLRWNLMSDASTYAVFRSTLPRTDYVEIANELYTPDFSDSTVSPGTTYFYVVTAMNSFGSSGKSNEAAVLPVGVPEVSKVVVSDAGGDRALVLSWNSVIGASQYEVHYALTEGQSADGTLGCSTESTDCTVSGLTAGSRHYLRLIAKNTVGGGSTSSSSEVSGIPLSAFSITSANPKSPTSAELLWDGSAGATSYSLKMGTESGNLSNTVSNSATSPTTVTGLTPGQTVFYSVTAKNAFGSLSSIAEASSNQPADVGGPILTRTLSIAGRVDLSWEPATGASPFTYTVQRSTSSGSNFAPLASCTNLTVTACNDSTAVPLIQYYYIVTATNASGSLNSNEVSGKTLGSFSISSLSQLDSGSATVTFGSSQGASSYKVKYGTSTGSYGTLSSALASSPYKITGLNPGGTYFVMIYAVNSSGEIAATAEKSFTMLSTPSAPSSLTANGNALSIQLSWGNVSGAGAVTYSIYRSTQSGSFDLPIATGVSGNTYSDTNVVSGTTYYYTVTASNLSGTSTPSTEASASPMGQPTLSSAVVSDAIGPRALKLSWPLLAGSSSYSIHYSSTSGQAAIGTLGCTTTGLSCTISGLTPGTLYYFALTASNSVGSGSTSTSSEVLGIPIDTPSLTLTPSEKQITADSAGNGATGFDLSYGTASGSYTTQLSNIPASKVLTGLENGISYYFKLTAKNVYGSLSSAEGIASPNGLGSFSIISAVPGDREIIVSWQNSANATQYRVLYGTSSGTYSTTLSNATSPTTFTGLSNGTRYYFMVVALKGSDTLNALSEMAVTSNVTPALSLSPVNNSFGLVNAGSSSASFDYTFSNIGTAAATGCSVPTLSDSTNFTISSDGCGTSNLAAGASCVVSVKATPTTGGNKSATLTWNCSNGGMIQTDSNGITATGAFPTLAWSPLTLDYKNVYVDSNSVSRTFTFTNTGSGPATGCSAPTLSSTTDFTITSDSCGTADLAKGTSCTVSIRATPQTVGVKSITLSRTCTIGGTKSTTTNGITQTAVAGGPALSFVDLTMGFGEATLGKSTNALTATLFNTGTSYARGCSAPALSNTADFTIVRDGCGTQDLVPGGLCEIEIKANPGTSGARTATLSRICTTGGTVSTTTNGLLTTGRSSFGTTPVKLGSFSHHITSSCVILSDQSLRCFGSNDWNSANVTGGSTTTPVLPTGIGSVLEVSSGSAFTCAILTDHTIKCWGYNGYGQLGDGTLVGTSSTKAAPTVSGISTATKIATGVYHACALLSSGSISCWGLNGDGQLGNGTITTQSTPVSVSGITTAIDITAGAYHTCAILSDNTAKCWGKNSAYQLGDGTVTTQKTPITTTGVTGAVEIGAGYQHTCVRLQDGSIKCWGSNDNGQIGNGTTTTAKTATTVNGITTARSLAIGYNHNCAILADGSAKCWGANSNGELADGTLTYQKSPVTPSRVSGTFNSIKTGFLHTCAILSDLSVKCWGAGHYLDNGGGVYRDAVLGDGVSTGRKIPTTVPSLTDVTQVSVGYGYTCVLLGDQTVKCFGANSFGVMGITGGIFATPTKLTGLTTSVAQISAGRTGFCALYTTGSLQCYGGWINSTMWAGISTASSISAGSAHYCALLSDGTLRCFGNSNTYGQQGNGSTTAPTGNVNPGLSGVTQVALGSIHSCALLQDHTIKCWGYNANGELGDGTKVNKLSPTSSVSGISTAVSIAASNGNTCALLDDGTIKCWGLGTGLGDGVGTQSSVPVTVSGVTNAVAITMTAQVGCALLMDGSVKCWGVNAPQYVASWIADGAVGDRSGTLRKSAVPVFSPGTVSSMASGPTGAHNCAIMTDKTLQCWGHNGVVEFGVGSHQTGFDESQIRTVSGF